MIICPAVTSVVPSWWCVRRSAGCGMPLSIASAAGPVMPRSYQESDKIRIMLGQLRPQVTWPADHLLPEIWAGTMVAAGAFGNRPTESTVLFWRLQCRFSTTLQSAKTWEDLFGERQAANLACESQMITWHDRDR